MIEAIAGGVIIGMIGLVLGQNYKLMNNDLHHVHEEIKCIRKDMEESREMWHGKYDELKDAIIELLKR